MHDRAWTTVRQKRGFLANGSFCLGANAVEVGRGRGVGGAADLEVLLGGNLRRVSGR